MFTIAPKAVKKTLALFPLLSLPLYSQSFTLHALSGKPEDHSLERNGDTYIVSGIGRESFVGSDDGAFVSFPTDASNFVFTARVAKANTSAGNPKYGIAVRSGAKRGDRMASIRYDGWEGNRCLQWFTRFEANLGAHTGARRSYSHGEDRRFRKKEGFWLRAELKYPFIWFYTSEDGEQWEQLPTVTALLDQQVEVGLHVLGGGSRPAVITYDQISFQELESDEMPMTRGSLGVDWQPEPKAYDMHLARVDNKEPGTVFITKPKEMT